MALAFLPYEWDASLFFPFQPFNHEHKVAKFCYADKVSPR